MLKIWTGRTRGEGGGVHHKTLVPCAVEVRHRQSDSPLNKRRDGRYAGRIRLSVVPNRSSASLCGFAEGAVVPGTLLITDDCALQAPPNHGPSGATGSTTAASTWNFKALIGSQASHDANQSPDCYHSASAPRIKSEGMK